MHRIILSFSLLAVSSPLFAESATERLKEATAVVQEFIGSGTDIPQELLQRAKCAVVIPGAKKGGFFIGAQYGRGFAICKEQGTAAGWGAPAAVRMEGGSIGAQIGGAEVDYFMLVMNDEGMKKLLDSKFTLGGDAGVAAGPVGRAATARTDAHLTAGILAWSRSRGAYAGATLGGATLRNDIDENEELYGKRLTNKEVITSDMKPPAAAMGLVTALNNLRTEGTRARETEKTEKK